MSWDQLLDEYVTNAGLGNAAALVQMSDGAMFAASPSEGEKGWSMMYADPAERMMLQEDMTETAVMITESATHLEAFDASWTKDKNPNPKNGVWIAGEKYKVTKRIAGEELGDNCEKLQAAHCSKSANAGCWMVATPKTIVMCTYDKTTSVQPGDACKGAVEFAKYLVGEGL